MSICYSFYVLNPLYAAIIVFSGIRNEDIYIPNQQEM